MGRFVLNQFTTPDGVVHEDVLSVHDPGRCGAGVCVVHNPSDHHMRGWLLNWRDDIGVMERVCPHGIGHPDPDHMTYVMGMGGENKWQGVHGCDSCCIPPANVKDVSGDCNS